MAISVLVLGGGIGGLSAAHELIERGFEVTVVEQRDVPGGKARSMRVPGSAVPPNQPLPGEHGFRFFPHFYRHIIDTMQRTPVAPGKTAADQLVFAQREMMAFTGLPPISFPAHKPGSAFELIEDLLNMLRDIPEIQALGLVESDFSFFGERLWQLMSTCPERAVQDFENQSWWDFMQADTHSPVFRQLFVEGLTRALVAAKAEVANVRAGGVVLTQLFYGSFSDAPSFDRLLCGPTSQVWITAWADYLAGQGVKFIYSTAVAGLTCSAGRIASVQVQPASGIEQSLSADHFVLALPIEYAAPLLSPAVLAAAPALAGILQIAGNVYDMTGIQFFLAQDIPLVPGHILFAQAPWALTGISQRQFWAGIDFAKLGDGKVGGILSIDISNWDAPGVIVVNENAPIGPDGKQPFKTARQCTPDEVALEVWTQMRASLTPATGPNPLPEQHPAYFIDPGMVFDPTPVSNNSKLFVNEVHSWEHRPDAVTQIPNLFIASDYVRTNTNLATMEAANEAARRAVNGLLQAVGSTAAPCEVWPLPVPDLLQPFLLHDRIRFDLGLPWNGLLL